MFYNQCKSDVNAKLLKYYYFFRYFSAYYNRCRVKSSLTLHARVLVMYYFYPHVLVMYYFYPHVFRNSAPFYVDLANNRVHTEKLCTTRRRSDYFQEIHVLSLEQVTTTILLQRLSVKGHVETQID